MPSHRAVLADIVSRGLNPAKRHRALDDQGHLTQVVEQGEAPTLLAQEDRPLRSGLVMLPEQEHVEVVEPQAPPVVVKKLRGFAKKKEKPVDVNPHEPS